MNNDSILELKRRSPCRYMKSDFNKSLANHNEYIVFVVLYCLFSTTSKLIPISYLAFKIV